jgi:hypothetical protein
MIRLPVSIGEAVDKLTILDIKCKRIQDPERLAFCKQEYGILYEELKDTVKTFRYYYDRLLEVNDSIWVMQDDIRVMENPDGQKCVEILNKNDMRFRIKDAINHISQSVIREKKGYAKQIALFMGHMGLGDHIGLIGAVRYASLQYDEVHIPCFLKNLETLKSFYSDTPSIKFIVTNGGYVVRPTNTNRGECIHVPPNVFAAVLRSGFYTLPHHDMNDLPSCFYRDLNLDPAIRHTYFHVPDNEPSHALYSIVKSQAYIFVQQVSSSNVTPIIKWDVKDILTIDPNMNVYQQDHPWYDLAQQFVNKPFSHYYETIKHAVEIHTVDSSFYCLASYLPLDANVKVCYNRETGEPISTYTFS